MKALNLYSSIGGNRKLWPKGVEVTAVENNEEIAAIYSEYFPQDKMIVGDAHEYLLKHYGEYDFIWGSRPCQSHSRARMWATKGGRYPPVYPDMVLYQEIIFLKHFVKCPWVWENVIPYYEPLIRPTVKIDRHLFWSNFKIEPTTIERKDEQTWEITSNSNVYGFEVGSRKIKHRKDQIIRNLVNPELGLYILKQAFCSNKTSLDLFSELQNSTIKLTA